MELLFCWAWAWAFDELIPILPILILHPIAVGCDSGELFCNVRMKIE
jgi:hypothetical protein